MFSRSARVRVWARCFVLAFTCTVIDTSLALAQGSATPGGSANARAQREQEAKEREEQEKAEPKQVPTIDVVRAALEPAYIAYPIGFAGLPALIFESNVVAHFMVHRPKWPVALVLTPKVVLRMFQQDSAPVKSPSFMPRITAYFWFQEYVEKPTFYVSLMLSHHSNGQSLGFFQDDGTTIRHDGGSFSTNFFELSLYATGFSGHWFGWSALSFEWHPGFNQNPELRGRYGLARMHLASTVLANLPLKGELHIRLSAILDDFLHTGTGPVTRSLERFPLSARYTITIPGIDLGLYVGYYFGHDYYNIYFDRIVHTLQVGISGAVTPSLTQQN